jgi:hypothetical protein
MSQEDHELLRVENLDIISNEAYKNGPPYETYRGTAESNPGTPSTSGLSPATPTSSR